MIGLAKTATGEERLALIERPDPSPGPDHAVLEVRAAGVCGTDLHIAAGEYACVPPVTLGHEVSGIVVGLGACADPAWMGARVVTETFFSTCGRCQWCRDGRANLCPDRASIGTHVDGGFAPLLVVPEANLHRIPDWLDAATATLAEPLACVCQCLLDPPVVSPGDRVLVVGPGPMGLLAAQVARALGGEVTVAGLAADAERLAVARRLGCGTISEDVPADAFEVAVEASGSSAGMATCLVAAARGGRLVQIGIAGRPVAVPLDHVLFKELELSTGFAAPARAWRRALDLIGRREVTLDLLVSEVVPLAQWERVFADLRASSRLKVVLDPRPGTS